MHPNQQGLELQLKIGRHRQCQVGWPRRERGSPAPSGRPARLARGHQLNHAKLKDDSPNFHSRCTKDEMHTARERDRHTRPASAISVTSTA